MEKDNIDKLFERLENELDIDMPNSGHQHRFLEKLEQQNTIADLGKHNTNYWKPFLAVAASIVLCFSMFTFMQQQEPEIKDLASVSPELSRTQDFFTLAIQNELATLEAERTPETEKIINDALKQLKILEADYEKLKKDLTESGDDKRVVYAMISNFQNRIDVLEHVLENIEEVKEFNSNAANQNTL
jgi:septal ring factor EnvC (AmiA/AmiB activator)